MRSWVLAALLGLFSCSVNHPALDVDGSARDASVDSAAEDGGRDAMRDGSRDADLRDADLRDADLRDAERDADIPDVTVDSPTRDASGPEVSCVELDDATIHICRSPGPLTYDNAQLACAARGGNLIMLDNASRQEKIMTLLSGRAVNARFGLRRTNEQSEFHWIDGTELGAFHRWATGQPSRSGGEFACGYIRSSDGRWFDSACYIELPFLCELR